MGIKTECPYCSETLELGRSDIPKEPISVECPSCKKLFEYIHGFGSFDYPEKGKKVKVSVRAKAIRGKENVDVSVAKLPQVVSIFIIISVMLGGITSVFIVSDSIAILDILLVIIITSVLFMLSVIFLFVKTFNEN